MFGDQQKRNPLKNGNTTSHLWMIALTMCMFYIWRTKAKPSIALRNKFYRSNDIEKVPKWIHFDNRKELVNDKLKKLAADEGIVIETSAPYSLSQIGVAERFNRTLLELKRAMIFGKICLNFFGMKEDCTLPPHDLLDSDRTFPLI